MIRKSSREKDLYLPYACFAFRDTTYSATGYTPFQLLFGRDVRGPLSLLYETADQAICRDSTGHRLHRWTENEIEGCMEVSCRERQCRQGGGKDKKVKSRSFEVGNHKMPVLS